MNITVRRYLALSFSCIYLGALVWSLSNLGAAHALSDVGWARLVLLLLLAALISASSALVLKISCQRLECHLSLVEALGLTSATGLLNTIPVRIGTGMKGFYLVYLRGLPISGFASITGVTAAVAFTLYGLTGVLGVSISWFSVDRSSVGLQLLLATYASMVVAGTLALTLGSSLLHIRLPSRVSRLMSSFTNATMYLTTNPGFMVKIIILISLAIILVGFRLQLISSIFDVHLSFPESILLATAASVSAFASIIPGSLGVREAAISGTFVAIGGGLETGFVVAAVDRIVGLIRDLIIGGTWAITSRKIIGDLLRSKSSRKSKVFAK